MKRLAWAGSDGRIWALSGRTQGVFVEHKTVSDFTAKITTPTTPLVGSMTRAVSGGVVVDPIEFEMTIVFASSTKHGEHGDLQDLFHQFLQGCSPTQLGYLRIEDDEREVAMLPCVVSKVPVWDWPNTSSGAVRGTFSFSAPQGLWLLPRRVDTRFSNNVNVTNHGMGVVHPKIRWKGAGGVVQIPGGHEAYPSPITLPPTRDWRTLNLDPASSLVVTDDAGVLDRALWEKVRTAFVYGVPPSESRMYVLPDGAELLWEVQVTHPWR